MKNRLEPPDAPSYYYLWADHWADAIEQRNILLNFIVEKGLDEEFIKYINQHFPENEDGNREQKNE